MAYLLALARNEESQQQPVTAKGLATGFSTRGQSNYDRQVSKAVETDLISWPLTSSSAGRPIKSPKTTSLRSTAAARKPRDQAIEPTGQDQQSHTKIHLREQRIDVRKTQFDGVAISVDIR